MSDIENAYFAHPINIHLSTRTIQGFTNFLSTNSLLKIFKYRCIQINLGWPKILIEVWHCDQYGRKEIYGYGTIYVPTSPGEHEVYF